MYQKARVRPASPDALHWKLGLPVLALSIWSGYGAKPPSSNLRHAHTKLSMAELKLSRCVLLTVAD